MTDAKPDTLEELKRLANVVVPQWSANVTINRAIAAWEKERAALKTSQAFNREQLLELVTGQEVYYKALRAAVEKVRDELREVTTSEFRIVTDDDLNEWADALDTALRDKP